MATPEQTVTCFLGADQKHKIALHRIMQWIGAFKLLSEEDQKDDAAIYLKKIEDAAHGVLYADT